MRLAPYLLSLALAVGGLWRYASGRTGATALARAVQSGEILRLHILADSDEPSAQVDKLCVRDAVLDYLTPYLLEAQSAAQAERIVQKQLSGVEDAARLALQERGQSYGVQALLTTARFPDRVYQKHLVPAGDYRTLQVRLGSAEGHNWWCVLYPTLCFANKGQSGMEEVRFHSALLNWLRKLKKEKGGDAA